MKANSRKIQLLIAVILLIFSFCIFYILHGRLKSNYFASEEMNLKWLEEANRQNEAKSLAHRLEIMKNEKMEIEEHFVKNSDLVPFLNAIEGLGPRSGVRIETTSVNLSSDKLGLVVELKMDGSFESIYKFITLLENSPYELKFLAFDIFQKEKISLKKIIFYQTQIFSG